MDGCWAKLWNRNYALLIVSNLLLYVSVYALIPVLPLPGYWTALFCFSLPLLGLFNNYLVDAFKRKNMYIIPVFLLSVCTLLYIYTANVKVMVGLRVVQGALFGLALMTSGSTLVIDVTPGCNRNVANFYFAWSSAIGLLLGLSLGFYLVQNVEFKDALLTSAGLSLFSLLLMSFLRISFRAPLDPPLLSFDRFILWRTLLPGINMVTIPIVVGILTCNLPNPYYYISLAAGFSLFLIVRPSIPKTTDGRLLITVGNITASLGLVMLLQMANLSYWIYFSGLMVGMGLSASLLHFLRMMILLPEHCERGTGFHTFTLLWEIGMGIGLVLTLGNYLIALSTVVSLIILLLGIGGLTYILYVHFYYKKALKNRIQNY